MEASVDDSFLDDFCVDPGETGRDACCFAEIELTLVLAMQLMLRWRVESPELLGEESDLREEADANLLVEIGVLCI